MDINVKSRGRKRQPKACPWLSLALVRMHVEHSDMSCTHARFFLHRSWSANSLLLQKVSHTPFPATAGGRCAPRAAPCSPPPPLDHGLLYRPIATRTSNCRRPFLGHRVAPTSPCFLFAYPLGAPRHRELTYQLSLIVCFPMSNLFWLHLRPVFLGPPCFVVCHLRRPCRSSGAYVLHA